MPSRVLILGGYGNFGSYVARRLAPNSDIQLLIGGRSHAKAEAFASALGAFNPAQGAALDIGGDLDKVLVETRPDAVIHAVGPFQRQDYRVAEACIARRAHYFDLADARAFVTGIGVLDAGARAAGVAVVSGASSVPCLTAAIVDHYRARFARLEAVDYGISAAQRTNRGYATATAILSYVGRPFRTLRGAQWVTVHGWQGLHVQVYPELGRRLFGDCDVPDLDLFPPRYPHLRSMRFCAGHEIASLHLGLWALSWLVRFRLLPTLDRLAPLLLKASFLFDRLGSSRSGLHMILSGTDEAGRAKALRFFLIARSGDGPNIPCIPAILLAQRLARGQAIAPGARPCVDLISLDDYLAALDGLDISVVVENGPQERP